MRSLPLDGEGPTLDEYRERHVPRWMRRICTLLEQPVRLDVRWDQLAEYNHIPPQLPRWGLNRIYGALTFACLDAGRKRDLQRTLKTVEITTDSNTYKPFARLEAGTLTIGLAMMGGDTAGCYEHDIAAALQG